MPSWSSWWPLSDAPVLGVDLDSRQARFLRCARDSRSWRVAHCAIEAVPAGALEDGRILQFEPLVRVLRQGAAAAGGGQRLALALPPEVGRRQVLTVPADLRPWTWRRWVHEQAELLGEAPSDALAFDVQMLSHSPLTLWLTVCPIELVQDWQGLAEAAELDLVLIDDRVRVMHLALKALGLCPAGNLALAEVEEERCRIHRWRPGEPPAWLDAADLALQERPPGGWVLGTDADATRWASRLTEDTGGEWSVLDPLATLAWRPGLARPADAGTFLAALGLALRAWHA